LPFETDTTKRRLNTFEACVTARKPIKESIVKYLCGILILLIEEEEQTLATISN
jgi:hypothetical protein